MRLGFIDSSGKDRPAAPEAIADQLVVPSAWSTTSVIIPDMMPLYDAEQFEGLIQRERARADRAAARPPRDLSQRRAAPAKGPGGSKVDPVWGATTDNREFSLVIFRPRTRSDRSGLVGLLQSSVRTTDAVGVVDNRRLGVLLPDTSAQNAVFFVKKVLAGAEAASVQLSHIVHTYPETWPDDGSPHWEEPRRAATSDAGDAKTPPSSTPPSQQRTTKAKSHSRADEPSFVRGFVNWLRRSDRSPARA